MISIQTEPIERHKYIDFIVSLSVELHAVNKIGLRTTSNILSYLNTRLNWNLPEIPSPNSIKNWVEKSGYYIYKESKSSIYTNDYAIILDESMMIGSEKMLLTLGVQADKKEDSALKANDVEILSIDVEKSWNAKKIEGVLDSIENKIGKSPLYGISDNASSLTKAIRDKTYIHIRDVGHTLAMLIEREYKNDKDFQLLNKEIAAVKFRECMRPSAYLLPPKQRTIARFMNLSSVIDWADKMLKSFHQLTTEEQSLFKFLFKHRKLIIELQALLKQINHISKILKENGLSHKTANTCIEKMKKLLTSQDKKTVAVAKACIGYLNEEQGKLTAEKTQWHISSDIIESLFGNYKYRKSPNALNGVTKQVLILPLLTKVDANTSTINICFKTALENVFLTDLNKWKEVTLTDNLTVKRKNLLNAS